MTDKWPEVLCIHNITYCISLNYTKISSHWLLYSQEHKRRRLSAICTSKHMKLIYTNAPSSCKPWQWCVDMCVCDAAIYWCSLHLFYILKSSSNVCPTLSAAFMYYVVWCFVWMLDMYCHRALHLHTPSRVPDAVLKRRVSPHLSAWWQRTFFFFLANSMQSSDCQ